MPVRIGINGFGRIGRNFFRALRARDADIDFVASTTSRAATLAHLLRYDSVLGRYPGTVDVGRRHRRRRRDDRVLAERDPAALPWDDSASTSCSSRPASSPTARGGRALDAGARKVVISAPAKDPDVTFVLGVNDECSTRRATTSSRTPSCTTNCLAPMVKVLLDEFGVEQGLMTTVHAYTTTSSPRRPPQRPAPGARGRRQIIPTSTGAARPSAS